MPAQKRRCKSAKTIRGKGDGGYATGIIKAAVEDTLARYVQNTLGAGPVSFLQRSSSSSRPNAILDAMRVTAWEAASTKPITIKQL